jgi:hypothetical protein
MTRDEAIQLQAQARHCRYLGDQNYDDFKDCDTFDDSGKEHYYNRASKYWRERDAINQAIKEAGFPDLVDSGDN